MTYQPTPDANTAARWSYEDRMASAEAEYERLIGDPGIVAFRKAKADVEAMKATLKDEMWAELESAEAIPVAGKDLWEKQVDAGFNDYIEDWLYGQERDYRAREGLPEIEEFEE